MRSGIAHLALAVAFLLGAAPRPLTGQASGAGLAGTVRDSTGNPIASAEVEARDQATGHAYLARTGARGNFWIPALPPSRYRVTARSIGHAPIRMPPLELPVGRTITMDLVLPAAAQELDELEVTARPAQLEATRSDVSFVLDRQRITNLPEESRSFIDLALLSPGATAPTSQAEGTPPVHLGGLNSYSVGVLVDGGSIIGPTIHGMSANFPLLAIQEFEVLTSGYSAEYGQAASGVINTVTRRGTNRWELEGFGLFRDRRLNALGEFEVNKPAYRREHWGFAAGGPLARDRTHAFVAAERRTEDQFGVVETGGLFPSSEGSFALPRERSLIFARLDHRLTANHELTLRYGGQVFESRGEIGFAPSCASLGFTSATMGTASFGTADRSQSHSLLLRNRWAISGGVLSEATINLVAGSSRRDRLHDGPALIYRSLCDGGNFLAWDHSDYRLDLQEAFSREVSGATGIHRLRVGAFVGLVGTRPRVFNVGNGVFHFDSDTASLPSRFNQPTNHPIGTDESNVQLGFFVQDNWSLSDRLTLNLGLRYDAETNGTNQGNVPDSLVLGLPFVSATPRPVDRDNLAPRLGFAWDPAGRGRTVIRGTFGLYYDQLAIWYASLERPVLPRVAINPGTTIIDSIPPEAFLPMPPGGRLIGIMDSIMETPFTRQFTLGVEHLFGSGTRLRVDGMLIQGRNLIFSQVRNRIFPPRQYPQFNPITQIRALGEAEARILTVAASRAWPWGRLEASYTLADRKTTVESWLDIVPVPDTTTDFSGELGPSNWDERHRLVVLAEAQLPWRVGLGLKSVYASARPWTVLSGEDPNMDDVFNDRPAGVGRNSERGPDYFRVDLGLRKDVPVGWATGELVLNVYNLFNRTNLHPGSVQQSQQSKLFGQALAALPKRQVEVGIRARF